MRPCRCCRRARPRCVGRSASLHLRPRARSISPATRDVGRIRHLMRDSGDRNGWPRTVRRAVGHRWSDCSGQVSAHPVVVGMAQERKLKPAGLRALHRDPLTDRSANMRPAIVWPAVEQPLRRDSGQAQRTGRSRRPVLPHRRAEILLAVVRADFSVPVEEIVGGVRGKRQMADVCWRATALRRCDPSRGVQPLDEGGLRQRVTTGRSVFGVKHRMRRIAVRRYRK